MDYCLFLDRALFEPDLTSAGHLLDDNEHDIRVGGGICAGAILATRSITHDDVRPAWSQIRFRFRFVLIRNKMAHLFDLRPVGEYEPEPCNESVSNEPPAGQFRLRVYTLRGRRALSNGRAFSTMGE